MTNLLETIQSGRQSKPPRVLLYGVEGIGKSTFGSEAPKPIFIQTEDGLDEIDCDRFPLATTFDDVVAALKTLANEKHDYESVVIDSLDWLERLVWDKLCQQYAVESIEKVDGGYARGYMHALSLWREVLDLLGTLRSRGMVIVLIAHSKVERFEDPESSPYDRYSPRLHKHAAALIKEWCDAVSVRDSQDANADRRRRVQPQTHDRSCDRQRRRRTRRACLWIADLRGQEPLRHRRRIAAFVAGVRQRDDGRLINH